MRRLILPEPPTEKGTLSLNGKEYRYLVRVLRLAVGDQFRALLPSGTEALFTIVQIGKTSLDARMETGPLSGSSHPENTVAGALADQNRRRILPPVPPIILCQALPKGHKMDLIIRQATEAGVSIIVPFVSKHSVPQIDAAAELLKKERWNRIIKEARQQSGSDIPTRLHDITDLNGIIKLWQESRENQTGYRALLFHQDPLAQGTLHGYLDGDIKSVLIAVGPEGGFSEEEAHTLIAHEFNPLLLGVNVLRTETAALFAAAAVQVLLLEKASWNLSNR